MQARDVKNAADARRIVEARGLSHVKLGLVDIDGVMRGKYVSKDKFFSALESGFGFCDVVLGWDSNDQLVDNLAYTGWHTAYPDAPARIVPESCREIPFEKETLFFLAEFTPPAESLCPRGLLRRGKLSASPPSPKSVVFTLNRAPDSRLDISMGICTGIRALRRRSFFISARAARKLDFARSTDSGLYRMKCAPSSNAERNPTP